LHEYGLNSYLTSNQPDFWIFFLEFEIFYVKDAKITTDMRKNETFFNKHLVVCLFVKSQLLALGFGILPLANNALLYFQFTINILNSIIFPLQSHFKIKLKLNLSFPQFKGTSFLMALKQDTHNPLLKLFLWSDFSLHKSPVVLSITHHYWLFS